MEVGGSGTRSAVGGGGNADKQGERRRTKIRRSGVKAARRRGGSVKVEQNRRGGAKKSQAMSCVRSEFVAKYKENKVYKQMQLLVRKRRLGAKLGLLVTGDLDPGIASDHLAN